jgi:hypothetical protein
LAEFQSRKAHRVHVRDKDLLKYLLCIVLIVVGYMAAWTAINMDHIHEAATHNSMVEPGVPPPSPAPAAGAATGGQRHYYICKSRWWDYVIEIGACFGGFLHFPVLKIKLVEHVDFQATSIISLL